MRSILHPVLLAAGLAAATSSPAWAAIDCFLKLDGVAGASTDQKHSGEMEVTGFSWDAKNAAGFLTGGPGSNSGKLVADSFRVTMASSKAGPALLNLAANGLRPRQAVLACRRSGGTAAGSSTDTTIWTLTDVAVTSFQTVGTAASGAEPLIEVGLSFGKLVYEYVPQAASGQNSTSVRMAWDVVSGQLNYGGAPVPPAAPPPAAAPVAPPPPAAVKAKPLTLPLPTK